MSGSNSSAPASATTPDRAVPLGMTVHSMPSADLTEAARRTAQGRIKMLLVLLVCAAPVIASYFTYFVIRPEGRTNYSELILPVRPVPDLPLTDLAGAAVKAASLKGQWLLVVVSGGACDARCEKHLWIQRQLFEALGREKGRIDKIWLVTDTAAPRPEVLKAIETGVPATVLRVAGDALAPWLAASPGEGLDAHMFIVDPAGDLMMRVPKDPEPARLKRDFEKLLRASVSWDLPGR
jgi:FAD/FMN-containing dehydrogenase